MSPGPADSSLSESGGRRLLLRDLNHFRQDVFVMLLEVTRDPLVADQSPIAASLPSELKTCREKQPLRVTAYCYNSHPDRGCCRGSAKYYPRNL